MPMCTLGCVCDTFMSFTCPREVTIVNYKLGTALWVLRSIILSYIVYSMASSFSHLDMTTPSMVVTGWAETGSMFTGAGQITKAANGSLVPLDVSQPPYCSGSMAADYRYSNDFTYKDLRCVWLPSAEMWHKQLPSYIFFTTFYQESTYLTVAASPPHPRCNSSSVDASVLQHLGGVTCISRKNYYTVNPEGMINAIQFSFSIDPVVGPTLVGSTGGTNSIVEGKEVGLSVTTMIVNEDGKVVHTFNPGSVVRMSIGDMLQYAKVSLDERGPTSGDPTP